MSSQDVTVCFISAYVPNCYPVMSFFRDIKRQKSLGPILTTRLLTGYCWEVMKHHQYSINFALNIFQLFGQIKKHLNSKLFASDTDMKQALILQLLKLNTNFLYSRIPHFVSQRYKCQNLIGKYVELCVYHPGLFIRLNKMVFISQTHLFIIVLNVLVRQHVSTLY